MKTRQSQMKTPYAFIDGVLHVRDREVILTKDLDDETLDAILNAKIGKEAQHLNYLLDDPES